MRYDLSIRESVRRKAQILARDMARWEVKTRMDADEENRVRAAIRPFPHAAATEPFLVGGVDGSGDYPSFSYEDSFVYVASAAGTVYTTDLACGLREEGPLPEPSVELVWLPEDQDVARERWLGALEALAGRPVLSVIEDSDYRRLKDGATRTKHSTDQLLRHLILPRASDTANVGIQLRSTAELGVALRLVGRRPTCRYVLMDTTYSLPMVTRSELSLFYEHVKRLCCVEARNRGVLFCTISKSHGLPSMELIEGIAAEAQGLDAGRTAEHWYLRLPVPGAEDWAFSLAEERRIPPVGAVTYLFRLHRNTPVMRLDVDLQAWRERLREQPDEETRLFSELDYTGHDQRAYGYPYPIKACHDRARLSEAERAALRKQIIDAAVAAGMKRSLFRDVSTATGHA